MTEDLQHLWWSEPATKFLAATQPYVDFEGAFRSQKSTALCVKILKYCQQYPGIHCALTRWTQDGLDAQLRPRWREVIGWYGESPEWNGAEEFDLFPNGSRVYLRALKSSEEVSRYGKLAGLTLAVMGIDQAEEVPEDIYRAYVPARLSQIGFPHQVLLTPNPPDHQHWICREFPEDNRDPLHDYLRTQVHDNRRNLGEDYIRSLEQAYPEGTAQHRSFVLGLRGLGVKGDPVYKGQFVRRIHVNDRLEPNPALEVYEAWDFGHGHPCVVWAQFPPLGGFSVLGGIQGENMMLYQFAPRVLEFRAKWFNPSTLFTATGDPAGFQNNPQGTARSAADILGLEFGVHLRHVQDANTVERRNAAIQRIGGYMKLNTATGPAFEATSRFVVLDAMGHERQIPVLVDGFEAGYVWDDKAIASTISPNTRRPRKDGFYDHAQNCVEYLTLAFAPARPMLAVGVAPDAVQAAIAAKAQQRAYKHALKMSQRDYDEYDGPRRRPARVGRGGW